MQATTRRVVPIDLVCWSLVEHATRRQSQLESGPCKSRVNTIRVDGTSPRGRGQEDVKESEQRRCFRVQQGQLQGQAVERDAQLADPAALRERGRMQDQGEKRKCDETSRQR